MTFDLSEPSTQLWLLSHRADPEVLPLADRHYNRQKHGSPQFVPPGSCLVLKAKDAGRVVAFWVTSVPLPEFTKHQWAGAWVCSAFRNESSYLSSELIVHAVSATVAKYGEPPSLGMVTFVDTSKTRRKRDPGRCFRRAGFVECGWTKGGLLALQLLPHAFPAARPAIGTQLAIDYDL